MHKVLHIVGALLLVQGSVAIAQGEPAFLDLQDSEIRLGDIAFVPDELPRLGDQIIARIPANTSRLSLDGASIKDIIRRQAPGMNLIAKFEGSVTFMAAAETAPTPQAGTGCNALSSPLSSGEFLHLSQLTRVACDADRAIATDILFDRQVRALRATSNLSAGTYLGRLIATSAVVTPPNTELRLRIRSGPVVIEREVRSMQPGRSGEKIFVQTADGSILSVRLEDSQP